MTQVVPTAKSELPKDTFIGGSLKAFREDPLLFMRELHRTYGDYARFRLGPQNFTRFFIRTC